MQRDHSKNTESVTLEDIAAITPLKPQPMPAKRQPLLNIWTAPAALQTACVGQRNHHTAPRQMTTHSAPSWPTAPLRKQRVHQLKRNPAHCPAPVVTLSPLSTSPPCSLFALPLWPAGILLCSPPPPPHTHTHPLPHATRRQPVCTGPLDHPVVPIFPPPFPPLSSPTPTHPAPPHPTPSHPTPPPPLPHASCHTQVACSSASPSSPLVPWCLPPS
jgi:hypothetical protein